MPKKNAKRSMYVTPSLGLFYQNIEDTSAEREIIGPFKTLAEAEEEHRQNATTRKPF